MRRGATKGRRSRPSRRARPVQLANGRILDVFGDFFAARAGHGFARGDFGKRGPHPRRGLSKAARRFEAPKGARGQRGSGFLITRGRRGASSRRRRPVRGRGGRGRCFRFGLGQNFAVARSSRLFAHGHRRRFLPRLFEDALRRRQRFVHPLRGRRAAGRAARDFAAGVWPRCAFGPISPIPEQDKRVRRRRRPQAYRVCVYDFLSPAHGGRGARFKGARQGGEDSEAALARGVRRSIDLLGKESHARRDAAGRGAQDE
mmetsp:Transcript_10353/g.34264  ORF Transcript_10353/g.34264 Transcript_10353/m.34264 type:complete len:259 (-) Transcript_10353:680-1456(-)